MKKRFLIFVLATCSLWNEVLSKDVNISKTSSIQKVHKNVTALDPTAIVIIDNEEYFFSSVPETLIDAMIYCNDAGRRLISLENAQKNSLISKYLADNGMSDVTFWTSGQHLTTFQLYTYWQWAGNGQLFSATSWAPGEPNSIIGATTTVGVVLKNGLWYDESRIYKFRYICETEAVASC